MPRWRLGWHGKRERVIGEMSRPKAPDQDAPIEVWLEYFRNVHAYNCAVARRKMEKRCLVTGS